MESLYKQSTLQIVNEYKKDNSIEGIRKIFDDIDKGVYPHLTKIMQANKENPFFNLEEAKVMKKLYNEHKSYSFLKQVIFLDDRENSVDKIDVDRYNILNQFYGYLEQQNFLCFCGEKYLSRGQQSALLKIKKNKDEFKILYQIYQEKLKNEFKRKQELKNVRVEKYTELAIHLVDFYLQTKDINQTITYAKEVLKISSNKIVSISKFLRDVDFNNKDIFFKICRKLVDAKYMYYIEEILNSQDESIIMKKINLTPSELRNCILSVNSSAMVSLEEKNKLNNFYNNYVIYHCKGISNDFSLDEIDKMTKIIEGYMKNEMFTIERYCDSINMEVYKFHKIVNILRNVNPLLIEKYDDYVKNKTAKIYGVIFSKAREMVPMIKNGIKLEDGSIRPFDILDYYAITSININELWNIAKSKISPSDYSILGKFVNKNGFDKKVDYEFEYNTKYWINLQYDLNGNIIPNTGREVTLEEKEGIINYLKNNFIPITNNTYHAALNRWMNGKLILDNQSYVQETELVQKK